MKDGTKMGENEVWERFVEGMKIAIDRINQLSKRPGDDWAKMSLQLTLLLRNGQTLYDKRAMTPGEIQRFLFNESLPLIEAMERGEIPGGG